MFRNKKNYIIALATLALIFPLSSFADSYGSNILTGGTASTDAGDCGAGTTASNVFDGNLSTYLCGATGLPKYIRYDLGSGNAQILDKISLAPYSDSGGAGIKNFLLYGSNDASNWTQLLSTSTVNNTGSSAYQDFIIPRTTSTIAFRYFQINETDSWRSVQQVLVAEWQGYSCLDCSSGTSTISTGMISDNLLQLLYYILEALIVGSFAYLTYKIFFKR